LNTNIIDNIISYCERQGIKVILVSTPMYVSCLQQKIQTKDERRRNYIDSLKNYANIIYLNYENDKRFTVRDFKNDDHLSVAGAKKFTELISSKIDSLETVLK